MEGPTDPNNHVPRAKQRIMIRSSADGVSILRDSGLHASYMNERIGKWLAVPRVRLILVLLLVVLSLTTALPNYLAMVFPIYGHFGFIIDENWRVQASWREPLMAGDVIDWHRLRFSKRYDTADFPRWARTGTTVSFPVIREGKRLNVVLVSEYHAARFGGSSRWWLYGFKKGAELLIVLWGAALVLIRPTKLSGLLFLYLVALATDGPTFWSFLPAGAYLSFTLIASIVAFPAPPTALALLALEISGRASGGWRTMLQRVTLWLFALSTTLIVMWIVREHFAILAASWVPSAAISVLVITWALATALLIAEALRAWRSRAHTLAWVCVPLAASALCYLYIDAASLFSSYVVGSNDLWALFSLLLAVAATYIIVRGRLIEARLYVTRAALSAVIGSLIVVALSLLNLAFLPEIARAPYVVSIEVLIAAWLGLRLSGLQDVAAATSIIANEAPEARLRGDRISERQLFARAVVHADRTRHSTLIAAVRAHAAFGAWLAGEEEEFERYIHSLESMAGSKSVRTLGRFVTLGQREPIAEVPAPGESSQWTARTELVACGRSNDALCAKDHARRAVCAAKASGDLFLDILAAIALAEFEAVERVHLYDRALACCKRLGAVALYESVRALATGKGHGKVLDTFVNQIRTPRPARPTLEVRFADASVRAFGSTIELRTRELALLLMIAQTKEGVSFERLADRLWPELDGDAARNVLKVTLHRLRRALGDDAVITRSASRYRLRDGAVVDVWEIRKLLEGTTRGRALSERELKCLGDAFEALRLGQRSRPNNQEWFLQAERGVARLYREVGQCLLDDALQQTDLARAAAVRSALNEDAFDEPPWQEVSGP